VRLVYLIQILKTPLFDHSPGKNDPHIRVPVGFMGSGRGKLGGENSLDFRGFGGLLVR
jgi:hypothetical protein